MTPQVSSNLLEDTSLLLAHLKVVPRESGSRLAVELSWENLCVQVDSFLLHQTASKQTDTVSARRGLSVEGQVLGASALLSENLKGWIRAGFLSTALALCTLGPERSLLWRDHLVHIGCLKAS